MSALAAVVALTAMAVLASSVTAITPVGPKPLSASLLTTSQQKILASGSIKALVTAHGSGRVKVKVSATAAGKRTRLTRRRTIHFTQPRDRKVSLKLTKAGAMAIATCSPVTLTLRARPEGAFAQAADKISAVNIADLDLDSPACASQSSGSGGNGGGDGGGGFVGDEPVGGASPGPSISNGDRCDWLDTANCLYPWPNDFFTTADASTPTGRKLNLNLSSMPSNKAGVPIVPTDYNVADGFSPGNMIITKVPGLDNQTAFDNSGLVPITDMARYADPEQAAVVINADTGQRQPIWAEIDSNPSNPADRTLIIRPAKNFDEGGHYIVALRNLKDAAGNPIEPNLGFRVYRDRLITPQSTIEARRPHMEAIIHTLQAAGVKRMNLYSAWDFTVASRQTLTERARSMRDNAFAQLGDTNLSDMQVQGNSPAFSVTSNTDPGNANIAREVKGTVTVPCYLNLPGCPTGSTFNLGSNGLPAQLYPTNTISANFQCEIPKSASAANPSRISLYGHGLLGSASEVSGGNVEAMANEHNITECATDWIGFSTGDIPSVLLILQDVNNFPKLADRTQQGFLDFMFLGRALIHPSGLKTDAAFQDAGQPLIDTSHLYYDGNSQGGILGGALTALAPDFNRAVLGVPAMNYSTLLERSTDFAPYANGEFTATLCDAAGIPPDACAALPDDSPFGLYDNYPDELERPLIFSLMQLLWDRGEPDGYAQHMTTDPLPNTPPHEVLMHPSFGDHQVANVAAEVEARTIGAAAYKPAFYPGRSLDADPLFGIPAIPSFPYNGSAIVYYDGGPPSMTNPGGTTPPPTTDTAPVNGNGPGGNGADPHSYPRNDIKGRAQKSDFLMPNGMVQNYCRTQNNLLSDYALLTLSGTPTPCYSHGFTGP
jgi:hypothetical protein